MNIRNVLDSSVKSGRLIPGKTTLLVEEHACVRSATVYCGHGKDTMRVLTYGGSKPLRINFQAITRLWTVTPRDAVNNARKLTEHIRKFLYKTEQTTVPQEVFEFAGELTESIERIMRKKALYE